LRGRIDPAGVDAAVQRLGNLRVDLGAEPGQATERRLDVAAGATETVVEIEVAKCGVEVVEPHQAHDAAAEPDAFGIAGRAAEGLRGFDEFVGLALIFLGGIRGLGRIAGGGFGLLILGVSVAALGKGTSGADRPYKSDNKSGNGKMAQNRILKLKHPSTHKIPDVLPGRGPRWLVLMPSKWVPNAAETLTKSHDGHFGFCPAKSQLYRGSENSPQDERGITDFDSQQALGRSAVTG
jgi:hypothetical protein